MGPGGGNSVLENDSLNIDVNNVDYNSRKYSAPLISDKKVGISTKVLDLFALKMPQLNKFHVVTNLFEINKRVNPINVILVHLGQILLFVTIIAHYDIQKVTLWLLVFVTITQSSTQAHF